MTEFKRKTPTNIINQDMEGTEGDTKMESVLKTGKEGCDLSVALMENIYISGYFFVTSSTISCIII